MNHRDARAELRAVIYCGDGGSLVSMLTREAWPEHALQLIGDGLLGVLAAGGDGVEELARRCVIGLRERGWEGDRELADGIEAALGSRPVPPCQARSILPSPSKSAATSEWNPPPPP